MIEGTSHDIIALIREARLSNWSKPADHDWETYWNDGRLIYSADSWSWLFGERAKAVDCLRFPSWEKAFIHLVLHHKHWNQVSKVKFLQNLAMYNIGADDEAIEQGLLQHRLREEDRADPWVFPVLRADSKHTIDHRKYWKWHTFKRSKKR